MPELHASLTESQLKTAWKEAQQVAELNTLDRVKTAATSRSTALTAVFGILATAGFAISPDKLLLLNPVLRNIMSIILLIVVVSVVTSQLFASLASSNGIKVGYIGNDGIEYRQKVIDEANSASRNLNKSKIALSVGVGGIVTSAALYFLAPVITNAFFTYKSIIKTSSGVVLCGEVKKNANGTIWLETTKGKGLPIEDTFKISPVDTCPPNSQVNIRPITVYALLKSSDFTGCGQLMTNSNGRLWLKAGGEKRFVNNKDELTYVGNCPTYAFYREKPSVLFTIMTPKSGSLACGQLGTREDGVLHLKTKSGTISVKDNPQMSTVSECPKIVDTGMVPLPLTSAP
jgi:hypothetical protein